MAIWGLTGGLPSESDSQDMVTREESGVVFTAFSRVNNANSNWLHVYKIPMLPVVTMPPMIDLCDQFQIIIQRWNNLDYENGTYMRSGGSPAQVTGDNYLGAQCTQYQEIVPHVWGQLESLVGDITRNVEATNILLRKSELISDFGLSDMRNVTKRRRKKAIAGFVSRITKFLFGIARDKDLQRFKTCLKVIDARVDTNEDQIEMLSETLQSFSKNVDLEFGQLVNSMNVLSRGYDHMSDQMDRMYYGLTRRLVKLEKAYLIHGRIISQIFRFLFQRLSLYQSYQNIVNERLGAVGMLVNDNLLSPLLVSPERVKELFSQVDTTLRHQYPRFKIAVKDYGFVFRTPGIAYTWDNRNIYIQIRIPLSSYQSEYLIYKPTVLSLPLTANHTHSLTRLRNLPELFAVSLTKDFYFELTKYQLEKCMGSFERYCLQSFPVISNDIPSCISGVYWRQYEVIKEYCEVDVIQTQQPSQILEPISNHRYLSVTLPEDTWYLTCGNLGPRHIKPVTFGTFVLKCNCGLRTQKFYLPPSIDNCHTKSQSELEVMGVSNLLYVVKWLDRAQIKELSEEQLIITDMGKFDIKFPNVSHQDYGPDFVPASHDLVIDLDNVIEKVKQSKKLHHEALSEVMTQIEESRDHFKIGKVGILVISGIIGVILVGLVVIFRKVNLAKKALMVFGAGNITPIEANPFTGSRQFCIQLPEELFYILVLLCCITGSYLIVRKFRQFYMYVIEMLMKIEYFQSAESQMLLEIILELTNGSKTVYLELTRVRLNPGNLGLYSPSMNMVVRSSWLGFSPRLHVNWLDTVLKQHPEGKIIRLPDSVPISILTRGLIRRMVNDPDTVYSILAGMASKYIYVPITSMDLQDGQYHTSVYDFTVVPHQG